MHQSEKEVHAQTRKLKSFPIIYRELRVLLRLIIKVYFTILLTLSNLLTSLRMHFLDITLCH